MKSLYSFISILLVGALIAFTPDTVMAGTVGKVNGVVTDATGQPLPGANVVIEGTPEMVAEHHTSHTARCLRQVLTSADIVG